MQRPDAAAAIPTAVDAAKRNPFAAGYSEYTYAQYMATPDHLVCNVS
jgi:hypothetical protein